MIEPVQFRMWRVVNNARGRAASLSDNEARVVTLAALTGVTETQARLHIARTRLGGAPRSVHMSAPRYVREKVLNTRAPTARQSMDDDARERLHQEAQTAARPPTAMQNAVIVEAGGSVGNDAEVAE
jgi:hypothetical protein